MIYINNNINPGNLFKYKLIFYLANIVTFFKNATATKLFNNLSNKN